MSYKMIARTTAEERSHNKKKDLYCKEGDVVIEVSRRINVSIVFGKRGWFPISSSNLKPMSLNANKLINDIKEVDSQMAYGFPVQYIQAITDGKDWEEEFKEKLKKSNVRESLKEKILKSYEK